MNSTGAVPRLMDNFDPSSDLIQEQDCDTLLLYLPGFTKEQLRVQLTRSGVLKISGTRPLGGDIWRNFQKDFPVSVNCDTSKITAKFEDGILYVRQPKLIVPAQKEESKLPPSETSQPPKTKEDPQPTSENNKPEQATAQKTTKGDDQIEKSRVKDVAEKSVREEETRRNDDRSTIEEKSGTVDKGKHEKASADVGDELVNKGTDQNAVAGGYDQKFSADSPMAKIKMAGQMMNMVIVVLLSFAFGIYVARIWHSFRST